MVSVDSVFATYNVDCHNLYGLRKQQNTIRVLPILCITLCITNDDFRVFCVTERASVTSVSRNKKADNRLIISLLLGAENETRTRDPNLGKVVLYQLSYFRKCGNKGNEKIR